MYPSIRFASSSALNALASFSDKPCLSNSLNIDSVSKDGVLTGLPGDSYINPTNQEGVTVLSFADTINSIEYSRREMLLLQTASGNWTFTTSPD